MLVVDDFSGILGFKQLDKIGMIQNRVIRYFMSVHGFTLILAIIGNMGWIAFAYRRWINKCGGF